MGSFPDRELIRPFIRWEEPANGNNSDMPPEAWSEFMCELNQDVRAQLIRIVRRATQQGIETLGQLRHEADQGKLVGLNGFSKASQEFARRAF